MNDFRPGDLNAWPSHQLTWLRPELIVLLLGRWLAEQHLQPFLMLACPIGQDVQRRRIGGSAWYAGRNAFLPSVK